MSTESIMNNGCSHNWEFQAVFPENFAQWVCKNCNLVRAQNLAHMMNDLCTAQALASKYKDYNAKTKSDKWQSDFDRAWDSCEVLRRDTSEMAARSWYTKGRVAECCAHE